MNKVYKRINWENDKAPAINESNLNRMDYALDEIDTRVVKFSRQKDAMETATQSANSATASANSATTAANKAADSANAAATSANTAAANANEAAQAVLDEKYILTATTEMVKSGTARPTAKGNALLEKLTGSSWQKKLTGKNKLFNSNYERGSYITVNGLTIYCNEDGSITINGTATATTYYYFFGSYSVSAEVQIDYVGDMLVTKTGRSDVTFFVTSGTTQLAAATTTDYGFTANNNITAAFLNITSGATFNNYTIYPMISVEGGDYEPYCGATPSPNPEFQQTIRSTGDMGWFDGEWMQGYLDTGIFVSGGGAVTSTNYIPCKEGDIIKIDYNVGCIPVKSTGSSMSISLFKEDGSFLSALWNTKGTTSIEKTVPSGASSFKFDIRHDVPISSILQVGHVCVTVNGKYAVIVDEVGKNLLPLITSTSQFTGYHNTLPTVNNGEIKGGWAYDIALPKPNSERVFSFKVKDADILTMPVTIIFYERWNSTSISRVTKNCTNRSGEFSTPVPKEAVEVRIDFGVLRSSAVVYDLQLEINNGSGLATNFVPHQSKRTYIPISEPLRAIGGVKDELVPVDEWYKVLRRVRRTNASNRTWYVYSDSLPFTNLVILVNNEFTDRLKTGKACDNAICSAFRERTSVPLSISDSVHHNNTFALHSDDRYYQHCYISVSWDMLGLSAGATAIEAVTAFNNWKDKNPFYIDYLCEPYYEDLDQTPFYNLQSFDEVTHVSIAGLHENVEPSFIMRFPRHEDGALVTTSYCTSKKAEIRMDELSAAMLALGQL